MFKEYFNADMGSFGYFFGLLAGAIVSVTLIYWAVFGFDTWKQETQRASDLMMAAAVQPLTQAPVAQTGGAGQYICPQDGAAGLPNFDAASVPHCPVCGQVMGFNRAQSTGLALARGAG
jgi:hypothetical protein